MRIMRQSDYLWHIGAVKEKKKSKSFTQSCTIGSITKTRMEALFCIFGKLSNSFWRDQRSARVGASNTTSSNVFLHLLGDANLSLCVYTACQEQLVECSRMWMKRTQLDELSLKWSFYFLHSKIELAHIELCIKTMQIISQVYVRFSYRPHCRFLAFISYTSGCCNSSGWIPTSVTFCDLICW